VAAQTATTAAAEKSLAALRREVDELVIVRGDGERVTATLDHRWFLAWWPHWSPAVRFEINVGGSVEEIVLGDRYDSGGPPCRVYLFDQLCIWWY
jgi:hypothetical protein